ncbi:MAG TPA: hypothetical protein VN915_06725 [Elusimicrobiota bacterium]|nr:hypothetical protein [Elusimicrobiota bacterium]
MAQKKKTPPVTPPPAAEDVPVLDPDPAADDLEADKLAEFQSNFGGKNYRIRVEKFDKEENDWEIIDRFPLDGFDPITSLKGRGKGRYRLTLLNEKGKYVEGGREEIRMAGPLEGAPAAAAAAPAAAAPAEADPLNHPLVISVLAMMEKSNTQTLEMMKALASRPEPARSSSSEVLDLFKQVRGLAPEDPMKELSKTIMLRLLERGLEGDGGGGGGDGGGFLKELRDGLLAAKEMGILGGRRLPAADPAPAAAAEPAAPLRVNLQTVTAAPPPPPPAKEAQPVNDPILEGLRPYAQIFRQHAENNADVTETANYLVDELYAIACPLIRRHNTLAKFASDDAIVEQIVNRAKDSAQLEAVFAAAPELAPHRDWCSKVVAKAIEILNNPGNE